MPLGINRDDTNEGGQVFRDGQPVDLPINFGTPVTLPKNDGNVIPSDGKNVNTVTLPHNFGNAVTE
jgi:hypothetical protein